MHFLQLEQIIGAKTPIQLILVGPLLQNQDQSNDETGMNITECASNALNYAPMYISLQLNRFSRN